MYGFLPLCICSNIPGIPISSTASAGAGMRTALPEPQVHPKKASLPTDSFPFSTDGVPHQLTSRFESDKLEKPSEEGRQLSWQIFFLTEQPMNSASPSSGRRGSGCFFILVFIPFPPGGSGCAAKRKCRKKTISRFLKASVPPALTPGNGPERQSRRG